ncbi:MULTISPECIES: winged helix-turn-helix domain-containing protein [Aliivibrio]|uniref:winged helix-turn-helix domain-containing protein n=1 Tax=Aliivibrio TaxID=511678 RepID=UPI00080E3873|nr:MULTISPECIES: winged helix-turn-helix domain-containing protein [Aliivibrio]MBD1571273.1 winged helix-turn-helix transcriptional regulator [Aliivibrio sp. S10_S31]OCH03931.1 transcriptional regulator [Aliivibrio fischeri]OCH24602.1 transcriptional regulator [Aliivibrio fischeri]OCH60292.1 transcriptional regulator [Aliivibrio fischeri]
MSNKIKFHNFTLLINEKKIITKSNKEIKLNSVERNILSLLIQNPTVIFTKEEIHNHSWCKEIKCHSSVVPQAISLLRKKLSMHGLEPIETVKGKGYKAAHLVQDQSMGMYSALVLFLSIISILILEYPVSNLGNEKLTSFKFKKINNNIVTTSASNKFDTSKLKLEDNVKYFINNQNNFISISACKLKNNICTNVYNAIYFKKESTPIKMADLISNVKFDDDMDLLLGKKDKLTSLSAEIQLRSLNNKKYNGELFINFDLEKTNNNAYFSKKTTYIKESGYSGGFGYASVNKITPIKNKNHHKYLIKKIDDDNLLSLRFQFGMVKNSKMTYAYNLLSGPREKQSYSYSYPISKNISYYFNDEMNISYIAYKHT